MATTASPTGESPLHPACAALTAVAATLIPHPAHDTDHVWNAGVHATIDRLHQEMTEAAAR